MKYMYFGAKLRVSFPVKKSTPLQTIFVQPDSKHMTYTTQAQIHS